VVPDMETTTVRFMRRSQLQQLRHVVKAFMSNSNNSPKEACAVALGLVNRTDEGAELQLPNDSVVRCEHGFESGTACINHMRSEVD